MKKCFLYKLYILYLQETIYLFTNVEETHVTEKKEKYT